MKKILFLAVLIGSSVNAQAVAPVDPVTAEQFRTALMAGDDATLEKLMSPKVTVQVTQQMGPDGPNRDVAPGKGKQAALSQLHAVLAAVGKPSEAQCEAPDGVSIYCQYRFDKPGRGMQSMIMFDGKSVGALMIKYGGIGL